MSFSYEVKAELCRTDPGRGPAALAECYGVLLFCNRFDRTQIRIVTGSEPFAQRLPRLLRRAFGVEPDRASPEPDAGGRRTFSVTSRPDVAKIIDALGYGPRGLLTHHVNLGLLEEDACRAAFLRGAFLAGGSVTDPKKHYHLELVTGHYSVSREMTPLLRDMGFEPGEAARGGNYILYYKQSDTIEDLLTTIGAPVSAMNVMSAKIEKDMMNVVNRKVNCDTANVTKTVEASAGLMRDIRALRESGVLATLSDKLREAADLREQNPELPLSELAALTDPTVTKSGLSHRLRKLSELAAALPDRDSGAPGN